MHYTRVYYWVSSWWANRIGLASLTTGLVIGASRPIMATLKLTLRQYQATHTNYNVSNNYNLNYTFLKSI